jgi:hypothetical protein
LEESENSMTLKWGTISGWCFTTEPAKALFQRYVALGMTWGALYQRDTPEQVGLICQLIDECESIFLDWEGDAVSKEDAKKYVREYTQPPGAKSCSTQIR